MELKNLTGKHILTGVEIGTTINKFGECCGVVKFTLDGVTYRAVEDPDDGYRSYMQELEIVEEKCRIRVPDVEVLCCMKDNTNTANNFCLLVRETRTIITHIALWNIIRRNYTITQQLKRRKKVRDNDQA